MKANELMVGDYLMRNGFPYRVIQVDGIVRDGWMIENGEEDCGEPIPLTPDILEKNGFECKHKGEAIKRMYWILNVEGGSVKVKINRGLFLFNISGVPFQHGFYLPSVNKHIRYVHELQHALRLCGIEKEIIL